LCQFANITDVKLIVSYGFDGSTGHSMYKQRFEGYEPDTFDHSLFVTTLIPLQLLDSLGRVLWMNHTTQSIRFCRPLKMEFIKESKEHILKERNNLDEEIRKLMPYIFDDFDDKFFVSVCFELNMTLIDGKVLNILTGTKSSQSCPICGATPKLFLMTKDMNAKIFKPRPETLQYGVSP